MNTSISLLSSTSARIRRADIRKQTRCAIARAYTRTPSGASGARSLPDSQLVDGSLTSQHIDLSHLSAPRVRPIDALGGSQLVDQSTTVAQRLHAIRQKLEAPTHAKCTPRRAGIVATYTVDGESGEVVREAYCDTCKAFDVSGLHKRYGHRVG